MFRGNSLFRNCHPSFSCTYPKIQKYGSKMMIFHHPQQQHTKISPLQKLFVLRWKSFLSICLHISITRLSVFVDGSATNSSNFTLFLHKVLASKAKKRNEIHEKYLHKTFFFALLRFERKIFTQLCLPFLLKSFCYDGADVSAFSW